MEIDWGQGIPLMVGPWQLGLAEPSPETVGYWDGVKDGRLLIKQCGNCRQHHHPRRILCSSCQSDEMHWVQVKGTGTVYTFSTVYRAPSPDFAHEVPYTVGVVHLAEGVYLFTRIIPPEGAEVRIGAAVELTFREIGLYGKLPVFRMVNANR